MTAKRNMGLKIPALKAINNNNNMTAEIFWHQNDCWDDLEKYDS